MRDWDHRRHDDWSAAWRELNKQVAEDLKERRGLIKPVIVKHAFRDKARLELVKKAKRVRTRLKRSRVAQFAQRVAGL